LEEKVNLPIEIIKEQNAPIKNEERSLETNYRMELKKQDEGR